MSAHNNNARSRAVRGSIKRGGALVSGLLRCGHCGAKLLTQYPGSTVIRYQCSGSLLHRDLACCVMFGGLRADRAVSEQLLQALTPLGIEAALEAMETLQGASHERIRQKRLALDQARYEVTRARRQYDAVDPANRLVAAELERRWNQALTTEAELDADLRSLQQHREEPLTLTAKRELLALAPDLRGLWDHPHLQLVTRRRFDPHRRDRGRDLRASLRRHHPLHRPEAHHQVSLGQQPLDHDRIAGRRSVVQRTRGRPIGLGQAPRLGSCLHAHRSASQIAPHRVSGDAHLAGNRLCPPAQLAQLPHRGHDRSLDHRHLRLRKCPLSDSCLHACFLLGPHQGSVLLSSGGQYHCRSTSTAHATQRQGSGFRASPTIRDNDDVAGIGLRSRSR